MIGPLTVGKKAAKFGYKRFGVVGALAGGLAGVGGYVLLKRWLSKAVSSDDGSEDSSADGSTNSSDASDESESATVDA